MRKIALTIDQKSALEARHKKSCGKHESARIKAVLLCTEGWSTPMIAQALRVLKQVWYVLSMIISTVKN